MTTTAPLVLDGSLDQRPEVADAAADLCELHRQVRDDKDFALGVLRAQMLARGEQRVVAGQYEFRLESRTVFWCVAHNTPPIYCRRDHVDGSEIRVYEVRAEPELVPHRLRNNCNPIA